MKEKKIVNNAAELLHLLSKIGASTQVQLAQLGHLRRTSVFYAFETLIKTKLVRQADSLFPAKGRPSTLWRLNGADAGVFLVAYFNSINNYYALFDFEGALISIDTEDASSTIEEALFELKEKITLLKKRTLCGVMGAIGGRVDPECGEINFSRSWNLKNYPFAIKIANIFEKINKPLIMIDNNSRLAAWGEKTYGNCKGINDFLTLHLQGSKPGKRKHAFGFGSGAVLDGKLYRGFRGQAGELDKAFYNWLEKNYSSEKLPLSLNDMDEKHIKEFAADLGEAFAHIANYLAPQKIVLLFDQAPVCNLFVEIFRSQLIRHLIDENAVKFSIETSSLGEKAILYGGADILRKNYFKPSELLLDRIRKS